MLEVAREREIEGDLLLGDMGEGLPFKPGTFDGAISISAVQWLCNADTKLHNPVKRMYALFSSLYACLRRGAKAVLQLYPENADQMDLITFQVGCLAKECLLPLRMTVYSKLLPQSIY